MPPAKAAAKAQPQPESQQPPLTRQQFYRQRSYQLIEASKNPQIRLERDLLLNAIEVLHRTQLREEWEQYSAQSSSQ